MPGDRAHDHPAVHAIVGPTGIGKSSMATALASATGVPVLVADRIQCFTDLWVTSGRAADESTQGARRVWLGSRSVSDGDYPPDVAAELLLTRLGSLVEHHGGVVLEGGSISLLLRFAQRIGDLPFSVSVRVVRINDRKEYVRRQCERARGMLRKDRLGRSLLTEFAAAWATPGRQFFTASISGPDSILEWCAKHSVAPDELAGIDFSEKMLDELSHLIGERYAEHGFLQERIFTEVFH